MKKKGYGAGHDFESIYEKWEKTRANETTRESAAKVNRSSSKENPIKNFLRWKPQDMVFEIEDKIIIQRDGFFSPEVLNEDCWHSCLENPSKSTVPSKKAVWQVSAISGRQQVYNQKVQYKVDWKQFNGRTFKR